MTLAEFIALLQQRCGSRDDLEDRIKSELTIVQTITLERTGAFIPWFLQSDPVDIVTVSGDAKVSYPSNYLSELEDSTLWYLGDDAAWHKLIKKSYDYILEKNIESGPPK